MDERLRALERRWQETGLVEDEATLLRERLRTGDLSEAHLRLAAAAGSPSAALVTPLEDARTQLAVPWGWFYDLWMERLVPERDATHLNAPERLTLLRATLALLRSAGEIGAMDAAHVDGRVNVADELERVCLDPGPLDAAELDHLFPTQFPDQMDPGFCAIQVVRYLRHPAGLKEILTNLPYLLEEVAGVDHPTQLRVLHYALVPYLLGYGDPLRE